jgi:hypothetical protein
MSHKESSANDSLEKKMKKIRKTILQQAAESQVRDPAQHAKNQVSELDKTAKRSIEKRRFMKPFLF